MATTPMNSVIEHLRRAVQPEGGGPTDGQLLECFLARRDEAAFEALVRRHGPMVLGVCRRVLRNHHDAEDAFQATFLVLVRKAASIKPREMVANWLYGVAYFAALKARAAATKRRAKEKQVREMPEPVVVQLNDLWREVQPLLDQELSRLPDKYRVPVVLCDLEGKTRKEAARQLGWPEGTLSTRLMRARQRLARRLAGKGLALSSASVAGLLAHNAASASVPNTLVISTVRAAGLFGAAPAAPGLLSTQVVALTQGVLKAMLLSKVKTVLAVVLVIASLGLGAHWFLGQAGAVAGPAAIQQEPEPQKERLQAAEAAEDGRIVGSGKPMTKEIKVADFTSVQVGSAFHVEIRQGDSFRTLITADDNLLEFVKAAKEGSTLTISVDTMNKPWRSQQGMKATITMPSLEGLNLSGATKATIAGFKSAKDFKVRLTGACSLEGTVEAGKVDLHAVGASKVTLKGKASEAKLSANGASKLLLADFALERAAVTLNGASKATVNARAELDYVLNGASRLTYHGNPTLGKSVKTGASSVSHK
jgi:RNA polymerase sigma factor (sigma-70 family)